MNSSLSNFLAALASAQPQLKPQFQVPLSEKTYFKIGGPAEVWLDISDLSALQQTLKLAHQFKVPITILGGGSNVIVSDQGVPGLVLQITNQNLEFHKEANQTLVVAGAGLKTALLVRGCLDQKLTGLEYFLGVPGTVGGAVVNNAHYLQHLISEFIVEVMVVNQAGETTTLPARDCDFSYDHSRFQKSGEIIYSVTFKLRDGDPQAAMDLIKSATQYRAQTQPLGQPSSGCIFQNTPNTDRLQKLFPQFAGQSHLGGGFLIDQAGLKGTRIGDIVVSDKHAAFFVNQGQGTASQVKALITKVQTEVQRQFGVELQPEVFWLGPQ